MPWGVDQVFSSGVAFCGQMVQLCSIMCAKISMLINFKNSILCFRDEELI